MQFDQTLSLLRESLARARLDFDFYVPLVEGIPRRASSFLVVVFIHVNRKEEEEGETEQFTKGCNILHRLQVYHLTLTFIIHNKYTSTLYLYTYMRIPIITIALIIMPFIDRINVRYKLLGTYI